MTAEFNCNNCIHKEVCLYKDSITNAALKLCIENLENYTTVNMNIRIECKYREEAHYNGTIKQANI